MGVRAGVIYPAFSLLSLRFVFSCSCYGCLLVVAAENHRRKKKAKKENMHLYLVQFISWAILLLVFYLLLTNQFWKSQQV